MTVIAQIRAGIERLGWSEISRRSGVDRTCLHRVFGKNGRGHPSLTTIERVLPHLGLELQVREIDR